MKLAISRRQAFFYTLFLLVLGILHHMDHVLRYDHSGWPFRLEVTHFTFSLLVYLAIISLFLINNKFYRISVSFILAIFLIGAHLFLETPADQFNVWAYNFSDSPNAIGRANLLDVASPIMGLISVILAMTLNVGVAFLPFVFLEGKNIGLLFL